MLPDNSKKILTSWQLWIVLIAIGSIMIAGWALYEIIYVTPPPEIRQTNADLEAIKQEAAESSKRIDAIAEGVRKEVQSIRVQNKQKIVVMPSDNVADGLNDELTRFRELATDNHGMGSS